MTQKVFTRKHNSKPAIIANFDSYSSYFSYKND